MQCIHNVTKLSLCSSIKLKRFLRKKQIHFWFTDIFPNINRLLRIAYTIPVRYLRTTMTSERLSGLAMMNIHYEKPIDYDAVVQIFAERYRRMLLIDRRLWRNTKLQIDDINAVYFYHSFLNANFHRCYAAIIVMFWCKKNGIFTLIKWDIKTRWLCSKWRKSRFRGLKISKYSWEGCTQIPHLQGGGPLSSNPLC